MITPTRVWKDMHMLQTDRLTNIAPTMLVLVTNMTKGQKLIASLSRFELKNFEKLWLTLKMESDTWPIELLRKWYNTLYKTTISYNNLIMCCRRTSYTWLPSATSNPINTITPTRIWKDMHMLQMDRLTNIALTLLVTDMTKRQKLISTLSRFQLENFENLWLTQKRNLRNHYLMQ